MGILSKILKTTGFGLSVKELSDYKKKMKAEGKDPFSPKVFIKEYGKPLYNKIVGEYKDAFGKNMGGMMEARKKGMGLRMANGGEAKFPDLSGDGKITQKDILIGKGVIKKAGGGVVKKRVVKRKPKARGSGSAIRGTKFKGVF